MFTRGQMGRCLSDFRLIAAYRPTNTAVPHDIIGQFLEHAAQLHASIPRRTDEAEVRVKEDLTNRVE